MSKEGKKDENKKASSDQVRIIESALSNTTSLNPVLGLNKGDLAKSLASTLLMAARHPFAIVHHTAAFGEKLIDISQKKRTFTPSPKDRRFKDESWQNIPAYKYLMQSYLAMQESFDEWVDSNDFDELDRRRARFLLRIVGDSIAPTNNILGNPTALKKAWETKGKSLLVGFSHFLGDLKNNGGMPSQVDRSKFVVGENIAASRGNVVFRNEILELIQYDPKNKKVYEIPLLVVPPQINKYYVFDLSPDKSFVQFCTSSSFNTFVVSWRNPKSKHKDWGIDEYVEALVEALAATKKIARRKKVNVVGACSGGITASLLLGCLEAQGDDSINSLSTSVCVLSQQEEDTEMSMFVTDQRVEAARKKSQKKGVLRGRELSRVFTWMRPNDLIWNYVVNNYLMGQTPPAFDVLYWNGDVTNLPANLHSDYLDIVACRALETPGETVVCGHPIYLNKSKCDKYIAAGLTDHITPWQACYRSVHMLGGKVKFVLSSSGHIQSLINPPGNPRSRFYTNSKKPESAEDWLDGAKEQSDTWWNDWRNWLSVRSGDLRNAPRALGNKAYPPLEPAPGTYVYQQAE